MVHSAVNADADEEEQELDIPDLHDFSSATPVQMNGPLRARGSFSTVATTNSAGSGAAGTIASGLGMGSMSAKEMEEVTPWELYPAPPVLGGGASGSGVGPASMMSKSRSLGGTLGSSAVGSAVSIGYVGEDDGKDPDSKRLVSFWSIYISRSWNRFFTFTSLGICLVEFPFCFSFIDLRKSSVKPGVSFSILILLNLSILHYFLRP